MSKLDISFEEAIRFVREENDASRINDDLKLKLYGLYKRITIGKCSEMGGNRPFFLNKIARSKFDSWLSFDNLGIDKCKQLYVSIISEYF